MKIDKSNFQPGHYFVEADIHIMEDCTIKYQPKGKIKGNPHPLQTLKYKKAQRLDSVQKSFWVEMDPPEGGIWEKIEMVNFTKSYPGQKTEFMRATHGPGTRQGASTYILEINSEHYDYKAVDPADEDDTAKYQYRLTIPELCELDLENGWKNIFDCRIELLSY